MVGTVYLAPIQASACLACMDRRGPLAASLTELCQLCAQPETLSVDLSYHTRRLLLLARAPLQPSLDERTREATATEVRLQACTGKACRWGEVGTSPT